MLSIAVSALALTIRDTPATPALRLRGGGKPMPRIAPHRATRNASAAPFLQTLDYTQNCLDRDTARITHHRARAGLAIDTKTMNTIGAVYHGGFGLGLYADPNAFADSGPSPLKYTADAEGPVGEFLGRAFGGMMLAMSTAGYFAPESEGVMKMYAVAEALFTPLLIKNIKDESGSMKTGMWKLQALMHIPLAALSLYKAFGPKDE